MPFLALIYYQSPNFSHQSAEKDAESHPQVHLGRLILISDPEDGFLLKKARKTFVPNCR